jgi:hypothetical protein
MLVLPEPARYSEDLDLVQRAPGPIRPAVDALRAVLDGWLGAPAVERRRDAVRLEWRYVAEASGARRRVKLEINTREHHPFDDLRTRRVTCDTRWFKGVADVVTYSDEELLATKLRALYQRSKGRDLFDLEIALRMLAPEPARVVELFTRYLDRQGLSVSRAEFEANLARKMAAPVFLGDMGPLLRADVVFDPALLFRGFLIFGIAPIVGPWTAIAISTGPYTLAHLEKDFSETAGCVSFGIAMGALAFWTGSFLAPWLVHFAVAAVAETLVILSHVRRETGGDPEPPVLSAARHAGAEGLRTCFVGRPVGRFDLAEPASGLLACLRRQ